MQIRSGNIPTRYLYVCLFRTFSLQMNYTVYGRAYPRNHVANDALSQSDRTGEIAKLQEEMTFCSQYRPNSKNNIISTTFAQK